MQKLTAPKLTDVLPESILNDEKFFALAKAIEDECESLAALIKNTLHLPRLDELSGAILDLLAWQFHVDFYEPLGLSDETKRDLIRNSIEVHRLKGTVAAVKKVNAVFNRDVLIQEWFEYGGEPYHFKISTNEFENVERSAEWTRQLEDAKNLRSWCDAVGVLITREQSAQIYVGSFVQSTAKISFPILNEARVYFGLFAVTYGKTVFGWEVLEPDIRIYAAAVGATFGKSKFPILIMGDFKPKAQLYTSAYYTQKIKSRLPTLTTEEDLRFKPAVADWFAATFNQLRAREQIPNLNSDGNLPRLHTLSISPTNLTTTGGTAVTAYYSISDNADNQVYCYKVSGASWISVGTNSISFAPSTSIKGSFTAVFGLKFSDGSNHSALVNQVTVNITVNEYFVTYYAVDYQYRSIGTMDIVDIWLNEKKAADKYMLYYYASGRRTYSYGSNGYPHRCNIVCGTTTYRLYADKTWDY